MADYEDRYYKTLDQLCEVRRERDVLFKALNETQQQLELARARMNAYKREREVENDGDD
ncbi:MAG: hypothetical protein IKG18_07080 [Atopobiaceae bacterium]|nr:hypothetical protein [Atopobiaceae bacterium]